jgi:hypothetical protein
MHNAYENDWFLQRVCKMHEAEPIQTWSKRFVAKGVTNTAGALAKQEAIKIDTVEYGSASFYPVLHIFGAVVALAMCGLIPLRGAAPSPVSLVSR